MQKTRLVLVRLTAVQHCGVYRACKPYNDSEAEKFSKSRKCITYASWQLLLIIEAIMHIVNIDHLTSDPLKSDKVKERV